MQPSRVLAESETYREGNRFSVVRADVETPDGARHTWTYTATPDAVIVLALDADSRLAIKKEWRLGRKDFVWELPSGWAGDLAEPVDPTEAADRELREEIGQTGMLRLLGSFYLSNHATTRFHVFLATELVESRLPADDGEHLEVAWLPIAEAEQRLLDFQEPPAQVVAALSMLRRKI